MLGICLMFNEMPLEGRSTRTRLEAEDMQHFIFLTKENGKTRRTMGQSKIDGLHHASIEPITVLEGVYSSAMPWLQSPDSRGWKESPCFLKVSGLNECFRVGKRENYKRWNVRNLSDLFCLFCGWINGFRQLKANKGFCFLLLLVS